MNPNPKEKEKESLEPVLAQSGTILPDSNEKWEILIRSLAKAQSDRETTENENFLLRRANGELRAEVNQLKAEAGKTKTQAEKKSKVSVLVLTFVLAIVIVGLCWLLWK